MWPGSLVINLPKLIVLWALAPCNTYATSVHSECHVHKFRDRLMNGQVENIMPAPASLAWCRRKNLVDDCREVASERGWKCRWTYSVKDEAKSVYFLTSFSTLQIVFVNPLEFRGNYSATLNHMKLVHWPLMGRLLHLVQRGGDWAGPQPAQAPPRCTKCNTRPVNGQCTNHRIAVWWPIAVRF